MLCLVNFTIENVSCPPQGPPGAIENACRMLVVVIFGLDMLGLVQFGKRQ